VGSAGVSAFSNSYDLNAAGELTSLSYLVTAIELCASGTAPDGLIYSLVGACGLIYQAPDFSALPGASVGVPGSGAFQQFSPSVISMFDTAQVRRLNAQANLQPDSYVWMVTRLYPGALATASVAVGSGGSVVTRSGGSVTGEGLEARNQVTALTGTAEEAFFPFPSNAVPVRLITPLALKAEETGYVIDLVFDPVGTLGACVSCNGGNLRDGTRGLHLAAPELMPVPRRVGFFARREVYRITVNSSLSLKVSLYFASDTPGQIASASLRMEYSESSASVSFGGYEQCRPTFVSEPNSEGRVNIGNELHGNFIEGLRRRESGTVALRSTTCAAEGAGYSYSYLGTQELRSSL
jgi:hypothetical protein